MSHHHRFVLTLGVYGVIVGTLIGLMLVQIAPIPLAAIFGLMIMGVWMFATSEFVRMATGTQPENIAYRKTMLYLWVGCLQAIVAFTCFVPLTYTAGKINAQTYKDGLESLFGADSIISTITLMTVMWVVFGGVLSMGLGPFLSLSLVRKTVFYAQIVVCLELLCAFFLA